MIVIYLILAAMFFLFASSIALLAGPETMEPGYFDTKTKQGARNVLKMIGKLALGASLWPITLGVLACLAVGAVIRDIYRLIRTAL